MTPNGISVIIPFFNEEEAVAPLLAETAAALDGLAFELVAVDDGSTDATGRMLRAAAQVDPRIRVVTHRRQAGQSTAIRTGVRAARHEWIVTLDGDGQNPPDQIPHLLAALGGAGRCRIGLVQGQRTIRRDSVFKRLGSRIANGIRGGLLHDGVRDSGCGLKLFRRAAYLDLPFFDHMHRFMAAMMLREGWEVRVAEVRHRPRTSGRSKYGNLQRALVGIVDLAGAAWLISRRSRLGEPRPDVASNEAGEGAILHAPAEG